MKNFILAGLGVAALVLLASCADRPMGHPGDPALLRGLIDGLLAPLAFVASLFTDDIRMYAYPNIGRWYDLGFMIGIGAWGGGGTHAVTRYIYVDRRTGQTIEQRDV